ncbi:MAG: hypothetical protein ABFC34_03625 [Methanobacterium sp.]
MKDKNTGEVTEMFMSISQWEQFKQDNPDKEQYFSDMRFIDEVKLGRKKPPRDFQEGVIERIKRNNPGHRIQSRWD